VGGAQPRLLLRGAHPGAATRREGRLSERRSFPLDGAVVPGLLLLVARDLALYDPPRVLAWRLAHDPRLAASAAWLGPLLPAPSGALDRDPVALLLAALAVLLALAYAALAAFGARPASRAVTIAIAASLLVILPSAAFVAMGTAADRPYGQDGGVVQLPLAIDRILAGQSPYGADYSGTILAREAHVSSFWDERGGNPILHHHAYLPGTHLVMIPFQLASRAALGFFDPRLVTLLFYALAVALAARVPVGAAARLSAAGVAALNPLAYWQLIFGANDVVFVAMLLGAVLLARRGRGLQAGALLGLACATKQLAWPFAPFLLAFLSGARSWRELPTIACWRRVAAPLAAAAAVFAAVVLPVAALDFRAFWGDVVVYNVGLPGGDNYPLGGTPGFGFGNFLIYFGRVASLRDYFPFSVFYVLLLPLGLLLLRSQLREGRAEWALATGAGALVASLYFSRVVHPNYLVAAAVLLPVAVLARGRGAAVALAPLLLLAVAVETAEGALFRTAWEQAAEAGLPSRLGGLAAALGPRAGPALTSDPLGLLFSATAAGLALACLSTDLAGAGRRLRAALRVAAAALVVVAPALVLVSVSERTGLVRSQDPAVVQAAADAGRLAALRSPYTPPPETTPRGREAVSSSFRLDPPAELEPERPLLPPGPALPALAGRLVGERDLRVVGLFCLGLIGCAIAASLRGESRQAALAVALLSPPAALGTALGSPVVLSLAALVAAWVAARRGRGGLSGALAGVAVALDHRALLAALPLLAHSPLPAGSRRATWLTGAAAYLAVVLPVALLDPRAFVARLQVARDVGAGLGLFNLLAYRGLEATAAARAAVLVSPLVAVLLVVALTRGALPAAAGAALGAMIGLALAPTLSAEAVLVPLVLLTLAAAASEGASTEAARPLGT
jgi:uncharacterized membrane protein